MPALCVPAARSLRSELNPHFDAFVALAQSAADEPGSMGDLEDGLAEGVREMQRLALERAAQKKADGADSSRCPVCGATLERVSHGHERTVHTRFGPIVIRRSKGYCLRCGEWRFAADDLLGLDKRATASPGIQRAAALLVSKMPAEEAAKVLRELTGLPSDDSTLAREARRQGKRAERIRKKMDEQACDTRGRWEVTEKVKKDLPPTPFCLVVMMDAWNIRERDAWGKTKALREAGLDVPSRWHWVYTATIFRLDQRASTQSDRPMILSRGYVATRHGLDEFSRQVYAEAVRQGLLVAEDVLVVCDGGVWLWNLAEDRFPRARKRLDFYHASQHLHAVADALHGKSSAEARAWVKPLLHQLRHGGEAGVIATLEELAGIVEEAKRETVGREANYFASHSTHMDYAAAAQRGEPIGSGAIESTCRQYQCRFKRPGQFWTIEGDEALLTLETFWRNERWTTLFPPKTADSTARKTAARN